MSRDPGHSQDRLPIGLGEGVQVVAASRLILYCQIEKKGEGGLRTRPWSGKEVLLGGLGRK
jgi:hypothetical protein